MANPISPFWGVFFQAMWVIVFEITLTKIFSVTMWYHYGYMSISLAMLGLGGGGVYTFLRRGARKDLPYILGTQALSIFLAIVVMTNLEIKYEFETSGRILLFTLCFIPFFCAGIYLSALFKENIKTIGRLYFFDLLGSAVGCIAFTIFIERVTGPQLAVASALIPCFILASFFRNRLARGVLLVLASLAIFTLCLPGLNLVSIKYTKSYRERADKMLEKWSALSRVTVYPWIWWTKNSDNPFGWGMSKKFKAVDRPRQYWLEQDASAGTPITQFDGNLGTLSYLKHDITAFPYHVLAPEKVFIVGTGGGRDILTALTFGAKTIDGCEIHNTILELMKTELATFSGNLYRLPQVNVRSLDARSCIRQTKDRYDLIQISLIDSWAATSAGAFAMTENSLYTVEAFRDYLEKLNDGGVISVSRYLFTPRSQTLRVSALAHAALEQMGVKNPSAHVVVIGTRYEKGMSTTLISKTPFSPQAFAKINQYLNEFGFTTVYSAATPRDPLFNRVLNGDYLVGEHYYDVTPTTDNRPYFFQMTGISQILDVLGGKTIGQQFNYVAQVAIAITFIFCIVILLFFFYLPLRLARSNPLQFKWKFYFVLIGLGFMFIELPLIQKGSLILGHPTYGLTVGLFFLLLSTGLGSLFSKRITGIRGWQIVAPVVAGLICATLELIYQPLFEVPFFLRVSIYGGFVALVGLSLGSFLPWGLSQISANGSENVPWAWAINGGASVLGSVISVGLSMHLGYGQTLFAGLVCYAGAILMVGYRQFEKCASSPSKVPRFAFDLVGKRPQST